MATFGFVCYKNGEKIKESSGLACEPFSYQSSNNAAEYIAMIKALEFIIENGLANNEVVIKGDSQLTIRQMIGVYSVKAERIIPLYARAKKLIENIKKVRFFWIPREENAVADSLSHHAFVEYVDAHPEVGERVKALERLINKKRLWTDWE